MVSALLYIIKNHDRSHFSTCEKQKQPFNVRIFLQIKYSTVQLQCGAQHHKGLNHFQTLFLRQECQVTAEDWGSAGDLYCCLETRLSSADPQLSDKHQVPVDSTWSAASALFIRAALDFTQRGRVEQGRTGRGGHTRLSIGMKLPSFNNVWR